MERAERSEGCLLGLAWGDALGCPVEYWDPTLIAHVFGPYETLPQAYPFERIPRRPRIWGHLRPLGLHSDDTQQALALLHACLQPGGFDISYWAKLLLEGARLDAWRGTGRNFRSAVKQLARGVPPSLSGSASAGLGAAMRVAPLGAALGDEPRELERVVFEASRSTHDDARAIALAYAVASTCARLVAGEDCAMVAAQLSDQVEAFERRWLHDRPEAQRHALSAELRLLKATRPDSLDALRAFVCARGPAHGISVGTCELPNHALSLLGGVHALAVGLWPEDKPQGLLTGIIRQGGDADTVGAIAGGILGARFGVGWLPTQRLLDASALMAYARGLPKRALPETSTEWLQREASWTRSERKFQRRGWLSLLWKRRDRSLR